MPAGHGGRAADPMGWGPQFPLPRRFLPSGCSVVLDTQSGHSGTPGGKGRDPMSNGQDPLVLPSPRLWGWCAEGQSGPSPALRGLRSSPGSQELEVSICVN